MELLHLRMLTLAVRGKSSARNKLGKLRLIHEMAGVRKEGFDHISAYAWPLLKKRNDLLEYWLLPFYLFYSEMPALPQWTEALEETRREIQEIELLYGSDWILYADLAEKMDTYQTLERIGTFELPTLAFDQWDDLDQAA